MRVRGLRPLAVSEAAPTIFIHGGGRRMSSTMSIDDGSVLPVPPPAATRLLGLRVVLILAALFEAYDGCSTLSAISSGPAQHTTQGLVGVLNMAQIVSHPFLGAAALAFALIGRVRDAIIALAEILAMNWLSDMPEVVLRGFELDSPLMVSHVVAYPVMAAGAIVLARRGERLGLATLMVVLPTLVAVAGITAFAIAISIHGF
jgi:hypothetical protein